MGGNGRLFIALIALIILCAITVVFKAQSIEDLLQARGEAALAEGPSPWATVLVDGRDATLSGVAPSEAARDAALEAVKAKIGFRVVRDATTLPPIADPFKLSVVNGANAVAMTGAVPGAEVRNRLNALAGSLLGKPVADQMVVSRGVPSGAWETTARTGISALSELENARADLEGRTLTVSGTTAFPAIARRLEGTLKNGLPPTYVGRLALTMNDGDVSGKVSPCQSEIDRVLADNVIKFAVGSATLEPEANLVLARLAGVALQCPETLVRVTGHTDNTGDPTANLDLSQARAESVAAYLQTAGIGEARLSVRGYGDTRPMASNDTPEGQKQNRRIEFTIIETP